MLAHDVSEGAGAGAAAVKTGLDRLADGDGPRLRDVPVALLCHPASVTAQLEHATAVMARIGARVVSLLGPEHGLDAAAQDMEVVSGEAPRATVPAYSLYGETFASLSPTPEMFHGAAWLVIDLQDIGSRYYTYVWTAVLAAEVALQAGLRVLILDRPNPIGGTPDQVEGGAIAPNEESFVGLHDVAVRHGMTLGELARMTILERGRADAERLEVLRSAGWTRSMLFFETGLPWVLPSPNMPTMGAALVYPGQCLLEGTNLSEGRGTTRPFEIFGAPWLEGQALAAALLADDAALPGLQVRPLGFKPMFQKFGGRRCGGVQLHIREPAAVRSLRTTWAVLRATWRLGQGAMRWRTEPYEFVADRPAIDLLAGGPWLREAIESQTSLAEMAASQEPARAAFVVRRRQFLLYPE
ncbi:exo-beta-N-acetylmuramidase NamZ family protein [Nannocystis punicea]|uniref:DUF1343 domain-containing protein n=1 Tax=Nannocystis punicea TaxID=2995304 RepID=A0ABY7HIE4_9BACT|nr:DUF1343 domain-containing protein [Nannocystis poenicansa]WAS99081.1 DUF1343 domain-containing protein [Nannocystis poenicansa]